MNLGELITALQRAERKLGSDVPVFESWTEYPVGFITYTSRSISHDGVQRVFIHLDHDRF